MFYWTTAWSVAEIPPQRNLPALLPFLAHSLTLHNPKVRYSWFKLDLISPAIPSRLPSSSSSSRRFPFHLASRINRLPPFLPRMTQSHIFSDFFEPTTLAIYFLAAPIGAIVLYCLIPHFTTFRPLSKYPGPFWAGYTRLWLAKQARVGRRSEIVHEEHLKHGQFIFFAPFPSHPSPLPILKRELTLLFLTIQANSFVSDRMKSLSRILLLFPSSVSDLSSFFPLTTEILLTHVRV